MLKEYLDFNLLKSLQDNFASITNSSVTTIDSEANIICSSGKEPFYTELLANNSNGERLKNSSIQSNLKKITHEPIEFSYDNNLANLISPIYFENKLLGAVIITALRKNSKFNKDIVSIVNLPVSELEDEFNKLPQVTEQEIKELKKFLSFFSNTIIKTCSDKLSSNKEILRLRILNEVSNKTSFLDLDTIVKNITLFIKGFLKIENCSITLIDPQKIFIYDEKNQDMIKEIDKLSLAHVKNTSSFFTSKNIKEDFLFKKIKDIETINLSLLSLPLKIGKEVIGMVNVYTSTDQNINQKELDLLLDITNQLSVSISNATNYKRKHTSSITDSLTNLYNKRFFMDAIKTNINECSNLQEPISLAIFDIDDFKHYNDINGHPEGDKLLTSLGNLIKSNIRDNDIACRYGGEEFVILMPKTNPANALSVSERVRKAVEEYDFNFKEKQPMGKVTISLGLVTSLNGTLDAQHLLQEADNFLYQSKKQGKNKTTGFIYVDKSLAPVDNF